MNRNRKRTVLLAGIAAGSLTLCLIIGLLPRVSAFGAVKPDVQNSTVESGIQNTPVVNQNVQPTQPVDRVKAMLEEKDLMDQQAGLVYTRINDLNERVASYNAVAADTRLELEEACEVLALLAEENRKCLQGINESDIDSYWSVLLKSDSFTGALQQMTAVRGIVKDYSLRVEELRQEAEAAEAAYRELHDSHDSLPLTQEELELFHKEMEKKNAEVQSLLAELVTMSESFNALLNRLTREQDTLLEEIEMQENKFNLGKYEEILGTEPKPGKPIGGNGGTVSVDADGITWLIPCDYTNVSSGFGMRYHPITGAYSMHSGVDLWRSGIYGAPIYATRDGVVTMSRWYGSGGNTIAIQHDDTYSSVYMHMSWFAVSAGDYVTAGQIIGYVGNSGRVSGAHLHFEIRKDGIAQNPLDYIG